METTVRAFMTTDVVTVGESASFKEIVTELRRDHVNAVPVLDSTHSAADRSRRTRQRGNGQARSRAMTA